MYYFICINYLTTELAHSKLNMVYLAELLVVMTDRLKIVSIRARNVYCVHGRKRLDNDASFASLSLSRSRKHKKIVLGQPVRVWQWPVSKKVVTTV